MASLNRGIVIPLEKYNALMENKDKTDHDDKEVEKEDVAESSVIQDDSSSSSSLTADHMVEEKCMSADEVASLLPIKMKAASKRLVNYLTNHSALKWNRAGRIADGIYIPDVVKDALSSGKTSAANLDRVFFDLAKNTNIPYSLITNQRRQKDMREVREGMAPAVPQEITKPSQKRKKRPPIKRGNVGRQQKGSKYSVKRIAPGWLKL